MTFEFEYNPTEQRWEIVFTTDDGLYQTAMFLTEKMLEPNNREWLIRQFGLLGQKMFALGGKFDES